MAEQKYNLFIQFCCPIQKNIHTISSSPNCAIYCLLEGFVKFYGRTIAMEADLSKDFITSWKPLLNYKFQEKILCLYFNISYILITSSYGMLN